VTQVNDIVFDTESKHLDRFGVLLLVTVLAIVGEMLFDVGSPSESAQEAIGATVVNALVGVMLVLAIRSAGVSRRWVRVVDIVVAVGVALLFILLIIELSTGQDGGGGIGTSPSFIVVILALFSPIAVVSRLVQHRSITIATLLGAVTGFLLIANGFNFAFRAVDSVSSTPFFGMEQSSTSFMYFSLVTVTTLGYGDLSPATEVARLLATTEAIIGQVYLVTVVAMAVGLFAQQRSLRDAVSESQDGSAEPTVPDV